MLNNLTQKYYDFTLIFNIYFILHLPTKLVPGKLSLVYLEKLKEVFEDHNCLTPPQDQNAIKQEWEQICTMEKKAEGTTHSSQAFRVDSL